MKRKTNTGTKMEMTWDAKESHYKGMNTDDDNNKRQVMTKEIKLSSKERSPSSSWSLKQGTLDTRLGAKDCRHKWLSEKQRQYLRRITEKSVVHYLFPSSVCLPEKVVVSCRYKRNDAWTDFPLEWTKRDSSRETQIPENIYIRGSHHPVNDNRPEEIYKRE